MSRADHRNKRVIRSAGYTLIELVVVLLLVSLFLGIGIPRLRNYLFRDDLKYSARKVIASIGKCRSMALWEQAPCVMHFDLNGRTYWLDVQKDNSLSFEEEKKQKIYELPTGIIIKQIWKLNAGGQEEGEGEIFFNPKGYTEKSLVQLQSEDGESVGLGIEPFLPEVRIYNSLAEMQAQFEMR